MLYIISILMIGAFLVEIASTQMFKAEQFYASTFFTIVLTITTITYSIFLVIYLKSLMQAKNKDKIGSALLHIGILFFLIFGLLHKVDYFYDVKTMLLEGEKVYEIGESTYIQWREDEQLLAIIKKENEAFNVVKKIPIYTNRISKWENTQFQQLEYEKNVQNWEILYEDNLILKIDFIDQNVNIHSDRFELIEFFPTYAFEEGKVITTSELMEKPGLLLFDNVTSNYVWISESELYGLNNASMVTRTFQSEIGLLIVHMRLMGVFILAASCSAGGYFLLLLTRWSKKKVQNELVNNIK